MVCRKGKQAINCYSISRSATIVVKRCCPHMLLELVFIFCRYKCTIWGLFLSVKIINIFFNYKEDFCFEKAFHGTSDCILNSSL